MLNSISMTKLTKLSRNTYSNTVYIYPFDTPLGKVIGAADDSFLLIATFEDSKTFEKKFQSLCDELSCHYIKHKNKVLHDFEVELKAYFERRLKKFTVPIKTIGSEFQKAVWSKLQDIPYATTQTYGELAKALGRPASHARAVGAACGANTHFLIIPCHRLIATNSNGGFNSGVDRKEWLIEHEKKYDDNK